MKTRFKGSSKHFHIEICIILRNKYRIAALFPPVDVGMTAKYIPFTEFKVGTYQCLDFFLGNKLGHFSVLSDLVLLFLLLKSKFCDLLSVSPFVLKPFLVGELFWLITVTLPTFLLYILFAQNYFWPDLYFFLSL